MAAATPINRQLTFGKASADVERGGEKDVMDVEMNDQ